jgi:general secretion pathway protein M
MANTGTTPLMKQHWDQFNKREQTTMLIGGGVLALLLFVFFVWRPMLAQTQHLKSKISTGQQTLAWMQKAIPELKAQKPKTTRQVIEPDAFLSTMSASLSASKIQNKPSKFSQSADNKLDIQYDSVGFNHLVDWLAAVSQRYQVRIVQLDVEHTDKPGMVKTQLKLAL